MFCARVFLFIPTLVNTTEFSGRANGGVTLKLIILITSEIYRFTIFDRMFWDTTATTFSGYGDFFKMF